MKRMSLSISVFLTISLPMFFSCGLPKTIFLSSPSFASSGANLLVLTHNKENYDESEGIDQSFKGYEIYYRAYESYPAAESAVGSLQSYKSSSESNPDRFMNAAKNIGFVRMRRASSATPPLVQVTSADNDANAEIQISDWTLRSTNPTDSFSVFRSIPDFLRWSFDDISNFHATDTDDYTGISTPSSINFVFFAVAYGEDPETIGQDVYSLPDDITISGNIISYP